MRVTGPYLLGMHPDPVLLIWCCTEDEDDLEGDFVGHSGDYWQDGDWTFDVKMPEAWEPVGIRTNPGRHRRADANSIQVFHHIARNLENVEPPGKKRPPETATGPP